jgi:hypothetical protein
MTDTLSSLISKVQAQLQDDGTLFTTATVTAAVRQALNDLNRCAPLHAAVTLTAIAGQLVYELSDEDPAASGITDVLLDGDNDYSTGLAYDAYMEDGRWFFRLRAAQNHGETLIVQYTKPHTISGLDGSLDSTLSDDLNTALVDGACYYACLSRAAAGIESNNIEAQVAMNWMRIAHLWLDVFRNSLHDAVRWPTARGEPGQALAWNDPQHDPEYP